MSFWHYFCSIIQETCCSCAPNSVKGLSICLAINETWKISINCQIHTLIICSCQSLFNMRRIQQDRIRNIWGKKRTRLSINFSLADNSHSCLLWRIFHLFLLSFYIFLTSSNTWNWILVYECELLLGNIQNKGCNKNVSSWWRVLCLWIYITKKHSIPKYVLDIIQYIKMNKYTYILQTFCATEWTLKIVFMFDRY